MIANDDLLDSQIAREIITLIVESALKKYKIDPSRAENIVIETIQNHSVLLKLLEKNSPFKHIRKTHAYDEVYKKARHNIYYDLRQYNRDIEIQRQLTALLKQLPPNSPSSEIQPIVRQLVETHISTKERLNEINDFYRQVFQLTGEPVSVIDIGCGMLPLLYPFEEEGKNTRCYVALDKDTGCIEALSAYAPHLPHETLLPFRWNIKDGWKGIMEKLPVSCFDIAFLLKLVPVVSRLDMPLLKVLLDTPAQRWIISGSRVSMTRYFKIENRERKIIERFISESGKKITGEFSSMSEFCVVLE